VIDVKLWHSNVQCVYIQEDSQGSRSGSINSRVSELSFSSVSRAAGSSESNLPAVTAAQLVCYCVCDHIPSVILDGVRPILVIGE